MKRFLFGMLVCILSSTATHAQVGYQVSLLNSATGEPRANETVSANVVITDSKNSTVYSTTQSATTNDFGVLSLVVGDANTFKDVAIGRLPLSISVSVGGTLIGKSQILNVPVAEVANTLKSDFTLEELCGKTWEIMNYYETRGADQEYAGVTWHYSDYITFYTNGTWSEIYTVTADGAHYNSTNYNGTYEIEGNTIYLFIKSENDSRRVFRVSRIVDSIFYY